MQNNLCCLLDPLIKNRSKKYCATCIKKKLRSDIKQMDWDKVARQIAKAQQDYLDDWDSVGWVDRYYEYYEDNSFEKLLDKVIGPYCDEEAYGQVSDQAQDYYERLFEKACSRVKIVVT